MTIELLSGEYLQAQQEGRLKFLDVNFYSIGRFYDKMSVIQKWLNRIVNAYFPVGRLRNYLQTHRLFGLQYFVASIFGAITPFCSCSTVTLMIIFSGYLFNCIL